MDITPEEALSLLRGWQEDRRIIAASLSLSERTSCCIIGRIEHLDPSHLRVDDRSISESEARTGIELDLLAATHFSFDDTRIAAGLEEAEQIGQAYEGFLFISLAHDVTVNLWVARTDDEIRSSKFG